MTDSRLIDHDTILIKKSPISNISSSRSVIAADAIIAGEGRMLTPLPFDMKLVIMGNKPGGLLMPSAARSSVSTRLNG